MEAESNSNNKFVAQLPPRIKGNYLTKHQRINLSTNLYKVKFSNDLKIVTYAITFNPPIKYDNRKLRIKILDVANSQVKNIIGQYVICGGTVFTCQKKETKDQLLVTVSDEGQSYQLSFRKVRTTELAKVLSKNLKEAAGPMTFLNNMMKNFLLKLDYHEIGKSKKYYTQKNMKDLKGAGVMLFNGYSTSFVVLEAGLFLKIDSSTRIVQNQSALQAIDTLYKCYENKSKDEKRDLIRAEMVGKVVMANYGNHRYWKIEDVVFDVKMDTYIVNKDTNVNMAEYYQSKYGLKPSKMSQPLFKASLNQIKNKQKNQNLTAQDENVLLVPQFMMLSGLPQNFDERKRREVSEHTIIEPSQKYKRIQSLLRQFDEELKEYSPKSIAKSLELHISNKPEEVEAINLGSPYLALGDNNSIESNKVASFMLFNKPLYKSNIKLEIMMFIPPDTNTKQIQDLILPTCKNLRLQCKLKFTKLVFQDHKKALTDIQYFIQDTEGKYRQYNVFWFVLPSNFKQNYSKIKKASLHSACPKLTQMTVQNTLGKKGFNSICTKLLLQMACKAGNTLWQPAPPKALNPRTMIIGIDSAADKVQKGTIIAYCATINSGFSQFHSNYHVQEAGKEISQKSVHVITQALNAYVVKNKFPPEEIIIMKNGCADSQIEATIQHEVKQSLKAIENITKNNSVSKLTYMIVDTNVNQKLFNLRSNQTSNPSFGTLINEKIVSRNYDFYMVSQHCNKGTVKPAFYKVIYSDSKMEEGVLQQLIYSQCFNYMNWTGSIRVPSVLQYAKKLSSFIGQYINCQPQTNAFNENLYFI